MKQIVLYVALAIVGFYAEAQSAVKKELYKSARTSFAEADYVDALRNFSEFKGANETYLQQHPKLKNAIGSAIAICEHKIEEKRIEEERIKNGISSIDVNAYITAPGPVYLFPTDSVISDLVNREWKIMLSYLHKFPFAHLQIRCITNADSVGREQYVMSRVKLFEQEVIKQKLSLDRIIWEIEPEHSGASLSSCMRYYGPPIGSICLNANLVEESPLFKLEP